MAPKIFGSGSASTSPTRCADSRHLDSLRENHPQHVLTLCAQRHANADFVSSLSDRIRHKAIDSDGGE